VSASLVAMAVGAAVSLLLSGALSALRPAPFPVRPNLAGRPVPMVLGAAVVAAALLGALAAEGPPRTIVGVALWIGLPALLLAGILDDRVRGGPRGILGHLRSLARGRPTTGVLKLVVGVGAGIAVALADGGEPLRLAAGAVLMVLSVNLFNGLDVAPGRSLKWAVVLLAVALGGLWDDPQTYLPAAGLGAAAGALAFDLRERGMLGDGGSNPLGLLVGAGLFLVLPTGGVVAAAVVAVVLQLAAETVTLSRLIASTPPLRWFDRVGRLPG
jgi:UDP-GlcNAc:undecaprenyl-phosphate/decaprenyl-phosphate GlcNAc-1-phosphate transferase